MLSASLLVPAMVFGAGGASAQMVLTSCDAGGTVCVDGGSTSTAPNSVAGGNGNAATGDASSAFGVNNTATGNKSSAVGFNNTAHDLNTNAFGYTNDAKGTGASAVGNKNLSMEVMRMPLVPTTMSLVYKLVLSVPLMKSLAIEVRLSDMKTPSRVLDPVPLAMVTLPMASNPTLSGLAT
jgi:hypothetical protein